MNTTVRYVAEVQHVREVSLLGTANLGFWEKRLSKENLVPLARGGKAQILIVAAEMTYKGIRFTEVSFSVLACGAEAWNQRNAAFLVQAFNSSRLFAFCERMFLATPYLHGSCRIAMDAPVSMHVLLAGERVFRAELQSGYSASLREPVRVGEDGWEGVVFLSGNPRGGGGEGRLFFVRVRGDTRIYPFLPSRDVVSVLPTPKSEVFQALLESGFAGEEWILRPDATHGKSRSYRRSEAPA